MRAAIRIDPFYECLHVGGIARKNHDARAEGEEAGVVRIRSEGRVGR